MKMQRRGRWACLVMLMAVSGCMVGNKTAVNAADDSCTVAMTATQMGDTDQYLLELRVWRERPGGLKHIIAMPQLVVTEGHEGRIMIGSRTSESGKSVIQTRGAFRGVVHEVAGRKVAKAVYEAYQDGVPVWRREVEVECTIGEPQT
ncbi:MAG: hypothetical protein HN849_25855 [Victivallales bacterium]|jgi:hypothetical protein|nr:hypothetical protein [Victivallales bacterium]MBT7302984.1 hypothetical protein [Victivallales bacterium]